MWITSKSFTWELHHHHIQMLCNTFSEYLMIATIGWGLTSVCAASMNVFWGYLKGARKRIVTDGRDCKLPPFLIHSLVDFCCSSEDRTCIWPPSSPTWWTSSTTLLFTAQGTGPDISPTWFPTPVSSWTHQETWRRGAGSGWAQGGCFLCPMPVRRHEPSSCSISFLSPSVLVLSSLSQSFNWHISQHSPTRSSRAHRVANCHERWTEAHWEAL